MASPCKKVTFKVYNHNNTIGISLTTAPTGAFEMGDAVSLAGANLSAKTATSMAAVNAAAPTLGTHYIVAEPIEAGDKHVVLYITKPDDIVVVGQPGSAS